MTTFIDFTPNQTGPFQFQPTLDGLVCTCIIYWPLFSQRWYIACYTLGGVLIFNQAFIGSPLGYDINLAAGYFTTSTLVYRAPNNQIEVSP